MSAVASALGAVLLAGCTVPTQNPLPDLRFQANTPIGALVKHVSPVWTAPVQAGGKTAATTDTLVAIDVTDGRPAAVAYDLPTGRELWRRPAGVGAAGVGSTRLDAVLASTPEGHAVTAFFAPADDPKAPVKVVLADPRTGDSREVEVPNATGLGTCKVVGGLCAEQVGPGGRRTPIRIDPVTGKADRLQLKQGPVDRVADLGGGVYVARRDTTTFLGRVGEDAWERPLAEFFGADVELPATLSWLSFDPAASELSITLRRAPLKDTDLKIPAGELQSRVIETQTGQVVWESDAASLWCPGGTGVSCSGELAYERRDRTSRTFTPVAGTVTYAGLPSGGRDAQWSKKLRGAGPATGPKGAPLRTPSGTWLLRQGDQAWIGDLATGELTAMDDSHWAACETRRTVDVGPTKVTALSHRPCTATQVSDAPAQFSVAGVVAVGVTQPAGSLGEGVPGFYAVAMPDKVAVFR
ncbi:hypothetical protein GCM10028815_04740 [Mariniluteicoccus flavus]